MSEAEDLQTPALKYVPPVVVLCFTGAHNTGKTTAARAIESALHGFARYFSAADEARYQYALAKPWWAREPCLCKTPQLLANALGENRLLKETERYAFELFCSNYQREHGQFCFIDGVLDKAVRVCTPTRVENTVGVLLFDSVDPKARPWELQRITERLGVEPYCLKFAPDPSRDDPMENDYSDKSVIWCPAKLFERVERMHWGVHECASAEFQIEVLVAWLVRVAYGDSRLEKE